MDKFEEIKKFKELADMGLITREEFQKKKLELLGLADTAPPKENSEAAATADPSAGSRLNVKEVVAPEAENPDDGHGAVRQDAAEEHEDIPDTVQVSSDDETEDEDDPGDTFDEREDVYREAVGLFEQGDSNSLDLAARLFAGLGDYRDSAEMKEKCLAGSRQITYDRAFYEMKLGDTKHLKSALTDFRRIPGHLDSDILAKDIEKKLKKKQMKIAAGIILSLIVVFAVIVVHDRSMTQSDDIYSETEETAPEPEPLDMPENGHVFYDALSEDPVSDPVRVIIRNYTTYAYYIKLTDADTGETAITFFVRPGAYCNKYVAEGRYRLETACGEDWYGEELLFGDWGYYEKSKQIDDFRGCEYYTYGFGDSEKDDGLVPFDTEEISPDDL